jgi:predicted negative regulator of RcsB-dependent stress response
MASIRDIKKDINYLTYEVLSDCMIYKHINNDDSTVSDKIMTNMIEKREDLITRLNEAKRLNDKKEIQKAIASIKDDLINSVDKSFREISKLAEETE